MANTKYQEGDEIVNGIILIKRLAGKAVTVKYKCGHIKNLVKMPYSAVSGLCSECAFKVPTTVIHGHKPRSGESTTYSTWTSMRNRCYKKTNNRYEHYGARGIQVCGRWLESFENFLEDMGERPKGKTLDRVDNDGDYCKENCRWATDIEQCKSKRNTVKVINKQTGDIYSLRNLSDIHGFDYKAVWYKVRKKGLPVEDIFGNNYTLKL